MSSKQSKLRVDMTKRMAARANEGASKSRLSGNRRVFLQIQTGTAGLRAEASA